MRTNFDEISVVAAADMDASARSLMQELMQIPRIYSSARSLLSWIESNDNTYVDLYISHVPLNLDPSFINCWWDFQAKIIEQARLKKGLQIFIMCIPSIFQPSIVSTQFVSALERVHWKTSTYVYHYSSYGDSIDDNCAVIYGVHSSVTSVVTPITQLSSPIIRPKPISDYIHENFNKVNYAVCFGRQHIDQYSDNNLTARDPMPTPSPPTPYFSTRLYDIIDKASPAQSSIGTGVYDTKDIFPPVTQDSENIFGRLFGIEYSNMGKDLVRPISPYEVVRGFGFSEATTQCLAKRSNLHLMRNSIPTRTSTNILDTVLGRLRDIRDMSVNVDSSTPFNCNSGTAQVLFQGATAMTLPDESAWMRSYKSDRETKLLRQIVDNPSLMTNENMAKLHYVYRDYLRHSQIVTDNKGMLYMRASLQGSDDMVDLQIVPTSLQNVIVIAFHANPIGGHFNAWRTFARIKLRFFWPRMYSYITRLISKCAGCRLSNPTIKRSAELVYNFPVDSPMQVLHIDNYKAGALKTHDGVISYISVACNMTGFGVLEGVTCENSESFASALMKIMLRYGFCHTIVVDKDSKFYSVFRQTADLLKLHVHTLSRDNHNPMLVERLARYFNKTLKIFNTEHGRDPRVSHEGLLMAQYAWNCANVPGTDISRCLMVTGREWRFPIDFSHNRHLGIVTKPRDINNYAERQAAILAASRSIGKILIEEQRAMHRELINSARPDPLIYEVGDHVFARRTVQSSKHKERVGKLEFAYTGPWVVTRRLKGASYECRHESSGKISKFHASHLSPVPVELIPFTPIDGADHRFGQSNKPLANDAYRIAGLDGFVPPQPFAMPGRQEFTNDDIPRDESIQGSSNLIEFGSHDETIDIHFPSLWELNQELHDWEQIDIDSSLDQQDPTCSNIAPTFATTMTPTPIASKLASKIVGSTDRLFFVSWQHPGTNRREWHLVQLQLDSSLPLNPTCLHDGRYLVYFLICHPKDRHLHPQNQRWRLEYHPASTVARLHQGDYHLLRPDSHSALYAREHRLHPFCQWINLLHDKVYLHGPFEFATINGRKTRDRINNTDWAQLIAASPKFDNTTPELNMRPFTGLQFSCNFHIAVPDASVHARVIATRFIQPEIYMTQSL
eukprot:scaffold68484_cov41-Cyclotella_meneghiniana.AAC.4